MPRVKSNRKCARCKERWAMPTEPYCGACEEEVEEREGTCWEGAARARASGLSLRGPDPGSEAMIGTKIEWATDTVNFWWGCSKVSPACEHCYAETLDARFHPALPGVKNNTTLDLAAHWGKDAPRLLKVESALRDIAKIRRRAIKIGERPRVFINSMSDFFEDRRDLDETRLTALNTMRLAKEVDFLLLTKRPEKIMKLLHQAKIDLEIGRHDPSGQGMEDSPLHHWLTSWVTHIAPRNIWLGTTVESQEWADKRVPELLKVPAAVHFLSVEPMLGPVDVRRWLDPLGVHCMDVCADTRYVLREEVEQTPSEDPVCPRCGSGEGAGWTGYDPRLDWVICGGESGHGARPVHPAWVHSLRDQCVAAGVPFHFKQWGAWAPVDEPWKQESPRKLAPNEQWLNLNGGQGFHGESVWRMCRVGKEAAGRLLDGVEHNGFPEVNP